MFEQEVLGYLSYIELDRQALHGVLVWSISALLLNLVAFGRRCRSSPLKCGCMEAQNVPTNRTRMNT